MSDPLTRIAAALERLSPPPPAAADPLTHAAYAWRSGGLAAATLVAQPLDTLVNIDRQKEALLTNLRRLAAGHAAHDALLWGARGTGKSALVKAAVAAVRDEGGDLALVEVGGTDVLPAVFPALGAVGRAFAVFVDDLAFDSPGEARALRSMLEGGVDARPANVRLVVTSNRRHLVPRDIAEQESAINARDTVDDQLALADRFGLSLGFHALDQEGYLAIVAGHCARAGLPFDAQDALQWTTRRGSRSGRVASQYVVELAGRHGRAL